MAWQAIFKRQYGKKGNTDVADTLWRHPSWQLLTKQTDLALYIMKYIPKTSNQNTVDDSSRHKRDTQHLHHIPKKVEKKSNQSIKIYYSVCQCHLQYVIFNVLSKSMLNCLPHPIIELSHTCLVVADGTAKQCISFQCSAILCNWATVLHSKWQQSIFRHAEYLQTNTRILQRRQMGLFDFSGLFCAREIFCESLTSVFLCSNALDYVPDL